MANPIYVTQSSSGAGTWKAVNTMINPQQLSWAWTFASTSAGSTANGDYRIEGTVDNPFLYVSSGVVGLGNSSSPLAGAAGGLVPSPNSTPATIVLATLSSAASGVTGISTAVPTATVITAWRINQQSSGLNGTVTFLQTGGVM